MNILLAICGSISAYKSYDIMRDLLKEGHSIKIVLTRGAQEFLMPKTFKYLGALEVYSYNDDFQESTTSAIPHIDLVRWCDRLIIAPCSANTLSSLANGLASDLLGNIFLAIDQKKPILIFPAMNTKMLNHPFIQEHMKKLSSLNQLYIFPTKDGELICGEIGEGKLLDTNIISSLSPIVNPQLQKDYKTILITTGATVAPIDPVRFMTNASSGLTGYHLAKHFHQLGHSVHLIAGKFSNSEIDNLNFLPNITCERVLTTQDMYQAVKNKIKASDIYISSAAISDMLFNQSPTKLKKDHLKGSLPIELDTDILKEVLKLKNDHQKFIGFAAETELTPEVLENKWCNKPVDLLVGTLVNNGMTKEKSLSGFALPQASYSFVENGKVTKSFDSLSKEDLATQIALRVLND